MADIMIERFGDKLLLQEEKPEFYINPTTGEEVLRDRLPSPNQLRRKIMVKLRKIDIKDALEDKNNQGEESDAMKTYR